MRGGREGVLADGGGAGARGRESRQTGPGGDDRLTAGPVDVFTPVQEEGAEVQLLLPSDAG
jgi:hypothetical protein